jgi:hypothetical protein
MQRLNGLVLIAAGIAWLTHAYVLPPPDRAKHLDEITRISMAPDRIARLSPAPRTVPDSARQPPVDDTLTAPASEADPLPPPQSPISTWVTVVKADGVPADVTSVRDSNQNLNVANAPAAAVTGAGSTSIVRDIQRHLRRRGCYSGPISGQWTGATRSAMEVFLTQANASLPADNPDRILLALVKSHRHITCSAAPDLQVAERGKSVTSTWTTITADSSGRVMALPERRPPLPGRMTVGAIDREGHPAPHDIMDRGRDIAVLVEPITSAAEPQNDGLMARATDFDESVLRSSDAASRPSLAEPAKPLKRPPGNKRKAAARDGGYERPRPHRAYRPKAARPYHYAQYSGKRRRGDPRPGTMRYNLMQSLGGIY